MLHNELGSKFYPVCHDTIANSRLRPRPDQPLRTFQTYHKTLKQYCSKDSVYAGLTCGALLQRNNFRIPKNEGWPKGYSYPY